MASANLDLVRSIFAAWEGGDFGSVEWAHPEIEWAIADGPSPGSSGVGTTSSARELIGWRATRTVDEMIDEVIADKRQEMRASAASRPLAAAVE